MDMSLPTSIGTLGVVVQLRGLPYSTYNCKLITEFFSGENSRLCGASFRLLGHKCRATFAGSNWIAKLGDLEYFVDVSHRTVAKKDENFSSLAYHFRAKLTLPARDYTSVETIIS